AVAVGSAPGADKFCRRILTTQIHQPIRVSEPVARAVAHKRLPDDRSICRRCAADYRIGGTYQQGWHIVKNGHRAPAVIAAGKVYHLGGNGLTDMRTGKIRTA